LKHFGPEFSRKYLRPYRMMRRGREPGFYLIVFLLQIQIRRFFVIEGLVENYSLLDYHISFIDIIDEHLL
jgi:hypothetical protein